MDALRLGQLKVGDQLPRMKDVVSSLSINPNTVQKAYRELEHKGIASGRPGQGTFVDAAPETVGLPQLNELHKQLVVGWLPNAAAAWLDEDGMVALLMSAMWDFLERSQERSSAARGGRKGIA